MGLTPLDIQNKEFRRAIRGYGMADVDRFFNQVLVDYEGLYRENIELQEKLSRCQEKNELYRSLEETMRNTLVTAQQAADDLRRSAAQEAGFIKAQAEEERQRLLAEARQMVQESVDQYENLRQEAQAFRIRMSALLKAQLDFWEWRGEPASAGGQQEVAASGQKGNQY